MFKQELLQSSDNFKDIYAAYRKATDKYIKKQDEMLEAIEQIMQDKYPNIYEFCNKFNNQSKHNSLGEELNYSTELLMSLYSCKNDFKILFVYDKEWSSLSHYLDGIIQNICFKYKLDYSRFAEISYVMKTVNFWHRRLKDKDISNILILIDWIKNNEELLVNLYSIEIGTKPKFKFDFHISDLSEENQNILNNISQTDYLSIELWN
jgi:hypothetical protein